MIVWSGQYYQVRATEWDNGAVGFTPEACEPGTRLGGPYWLGYEQPRFWQRSLRRARGLAVTRAKRLDDRKRQSTAAMKVVACLTGENGE